MDGTLCSSYSFGIGCNWASQKNKDLIEHRCLERVPLVFDGPLYHELRQKLFDRCKTVFLMVE